MSANNKIPCPHCGSTLLWSEDRGAHCDGCDDFDPETDLPPQMTPPIPIPRELLERLTQAAKERRERFEQANGDFMRLNEVLNGMDADIRAAEELLKPAAPTDPQKVQNVIDGIWPHPSPVHRITAGSVIPFPCWLWRNSSSPHWQKFGSIPPGDWLADYTYWSDSPTAPQPPREGA